MTIITRLVLIAAAASAVQLVAASTVKRGAESCSSNEFWYDTKSCCVPHGMPSNPPSAPSGKACPSTESWYWSNDKSCCIPSTPPPSNNPTPSCPNSYSWDNDNSCCSQPQPSSPSPPSSPSECQSSEFWYEPKSCCLPNGGPPSPPSPPKGGNCPSSGWYWGDDQGCCVPHQPNPPSPTCPSGWNWMSSIWQCQQPSPPSSPPPKPSGHYSKRTHKSRSASLCPGGLDACPIRGLSGVGADYECIDIAVELESCGGCASIGQGQDCTAIRGAWNVGCEQGKCTVYTCSAGYKRAPDGKSCIPLL